MSADLPSAKPRKGLAIAALVLGIASILTFGLFVVGAIAGIILGVIALNKIKQNPQVYGGRNQAVAGIQASVVSLVPAIILMAMGTLKLQEYRKLGMQTAAINTLRTIHQNEAQYKEMKGKFGTLQELRQAGLLDQIYSESQPTSNYFYSDSDVSKDTYCLHARRLRANVAYSDFVVCEDGVIRHIESKTPATVKRGEGIPLRGAGESEKSQ